jgi:biotin operon repressor
MVEKRSGRIQHIRELIEERNIILKGADALSQHGFTQVPNHMLRSDKISPGAKLTYTMLLSYAWQNDYCFPGQERLAHDMGVTDRSVRTYLQELQGKGFLTIRRQGQGRPNIYELDVRKAAPKSGRASSPDRKNFPL